jgi:ATP-binding cassette subfamily F protein uup
VTAPVLLSCERLSKAFGARPLFEDLTFALHEGDHVGLVGPNGAGKSTLLKLLSGLETPDAGTCTRRRALRVAYVPQDPVFPPGSTAESVVAAEVAGDDRVDDADRSRRVSVALSRTGFEDHAVLTDTLSGGWRARLAIARALALEPELLLLDEPTNHLDLDSIRWLETFLGGEPGAFVVVSHDRYFLQRVTTRMIEINRMYDGGLLSVPGSYADLLEARETILESQASYRESLANRVRREVAWLRRGAKARTSKAKARIQAAERSIDELKERRERSAAVSAGIDLTASGRKTKRLWSCEGLRKGFGERRIVDGLDLLLGPGMRVGVLGPNGSGKTTLLRLIVGELQPDAGKIRRADDLRVVYFDQNRRSLDTSLTLKRALAPHGDSIVYRERSLHVASWAKRFLFRTEQLETPVSELSGGERARIVLARVMREPADLLVLDEPTNDLDIPTLEVLEDSLVDFPGALVLVTHDRRMIDRVSTRMIALDGRGGVQSYADYDQWEAQAAPEPVRKKRKPAAPDRRPAQRKPRKLSYLDQREWDGMEERVLDAEARLEEAKQRAQDPSIAADAAALQERLAKLQEAQSAVDALYARWAELEAKLEPSG